MVYSLLVLDEVHTNGLVALRRSSYCFVFRSWWTQTASMSSERDTAATLHIDGGDGQYSFHALHVIRILAKGSFALHSQWNHDEIWTTTGFHKTMWLDIAVTFRPCIKSTLVASWRIITHYGRHSLHITSGWVWIHWRSTWYYFENKYSLHIINIHNAFTPVTEIPKSISSLIGWIWSVRIVLQLQRTTVIDTQYCRYYYNQQ